MKKWLMYLFMGVGLLYTYALASIFRQYKRDVQDDTSPHKDFEQN